MRRDEIEIELNRGRIAQLETYGALSDADRTRPSTASEHDPESKWSAQDHLVHLTGFEQIFNEMLTRKISGHANPLGPVIGDDGVRRSRDEVLAYVGRLNEEFVVQHRGISFDAVVALGQATRAATLELLSGLTQAQLDEKIPGAPWGDGSLGGIMAASTDHGRTHWQWIEEARQPAATMS